MNKLHTIKEKLKNKRGIGSHFNDLEKSIQKQQVAADKFIEAIEDKAVAKIINAAQGKLLERSKELVNEVKDILEKNHDGFQEVISYLEKQDMRSELLSKESQAVYKNIVTSLKTLAKQTQEVVVKNHPKTLTVKEIQSAFTNALDKVENILVSQNEIPSGASVSYNAEGKVSQITENYDGYKLVTTIRYTDGKVSSWTTTKK